MQIINEQGSIPKIVNQSLCPKCGLPNKCGVELGKGTCWCFGYPKLENSKYEETNQCLCERCLRIELNSENIKT